MHKQQTYDSSFTATRAAVTGVIYVANAIPWIGRPVSYGLEIAEGIWGDYLYNYVTEEFDE